MTKKQIELLNDLTEISVSIYNGCLTIMNFSREGNKFYNDERTIEFDLETIASNGRSVNTLFKDMMQFVLDSFMVRWHDTEESEKWAFGWHEGYDLFVSYISHIYMYVDRSFRYKYVDWTNPKSLERLAAVKKAVALETIE